MIVKPESCQPPSSRRAGKMLLARAGPSLIVGVGDHEYFVASDVAPLLPHTRDVVFLEDGDIAELTHVSMRITDRDGQAVLRPLRHVDGDASTAELSGPRIGQRHDRDFGDSWVTTEELLHLTRGDLLA